MCGVGEASHWSGCGQTSRFGGKGRVQHRDGSDRACGESSERIGERWRGVREESAGVGRWAEVERQGVGDGCERRIRENSVVVG